MDNLFNLLRLRNIFSPQGPIGNDLPEQGGFGGNLPRDIGPIKLGMSDYPDRNIFDVPTVRSQEEDPLDSLIRLYHPSTDMSDLYKDTILNMPERNKNVGFGRKVLGVLGSIGGRPDTYDRITQPDYYKDMDTWEARLKAISPAMQTERLANVNERMSINDLIKARLGQEKEDRIREYGNRNLAIKERTQTMREILANQPNLDVLEPKGGNYTLIDKKNSNFKPIDTGIPVGTLDELTLQNMITNRGLAVAREQGAEARKTESVRESNREELEGIRQGNRESLEEKRIKGRKEVKITPSADSDTTKNLPTQERVRQFNRAREAYNSRPEWRKYIKLGNPGTNDFTIVAPGRFSGPDKKTYNEINQYIYNRFEADTNTGAQTTVRVRDPKTKQTGTFKGTAEEAKKAGFEVLQ